MKKADAPKSILVWDTETTGTDVEKDRILTCYAMLKGIDGTLIKEWSWTIDPGVPVDPKASEIHGMTTAWIQENGRKDAKQAIEEIYDVLVDAVNEGVPIVAYNQPFDLTLLDREMTRHGYVNGVKWVVDNGLFFDPIVFDRAVDKYRKGKRKLMNVAGAYGIELDESRLHEAQYDVEVTSKLTWVLFQRKCKWTLEELQPLLKKWKKEQAESLQSHFAKTGKFNDDGSPIIIETGFPYNERPLW